MLKIKTMKLKDIYSTNTMKSLNIKTRTVQATRIASTFQSFLKKKGTFLFPSFFIFVSAGDLDTIKISTQWQLKSSKKEILMQVYSEFLNCFASQLLILL